MQILQTVAMTSESGQSKKTRATYKKHDYILVSTVSIQKEVNDWIAKAKCLAYLTTSSNARSLIAYYRCSQICRTKYKKCPVRAKVEKPENNLLFRIFHTT